MFQIRYVTGADRPFWLGLDPHLRESELTLKIRDRRGYVICDGVKPVGLMRYSLFWDNTPFLNLIYLDEAYRGQGFGKRAMRFWEDEMRGLGYEMVMTSTQVDEQAQHFYRRLGYVDKGSMFFDHTPCEQPQELIMMKVL